jgi:hypothetical protein
MLTESRISDEPVDAGANAVAGPLFGSELRYALQALGPIVCLHRREDAPQLACDAWALIRDARLQVAVEIDSEGPREALRFARPGGGVLLQICLLPDSDFLVWEQLLECSRPQLAEGPLCWPSWLARVRWQARIGRFGETSEGLGFMPLVRTSACGSRSAEAWRARCGCGPCRD